MSAFFRVPEKSGSTVNQIVREPEKSGTCIFVEIWGGPEIQQSFGAILPPGWAIYTAAARVNVLKRASL